VGENLVGVEAVIQIIVKIVPGGDQAKAFEQAVAEISHVAGDTIADYAVSVGESQNPVSGTLDWSAKGHVLAHDRRASVWALVEKVARFAVAEADKAGRQ
jgi:hypothetical protein